MNCAHCNNSTQSKLRCGTCYRVICKRKCKHNNPQNNKSNNGLNKDFSPTQAIIDLTKDMMLNNRELLKAQPELLNQNFDLLKNVMELEMGFEREKSKIEMMSSPLYQARPKPNTVNDLIEKALNDTKN